MDAQDHEPKLSLPEVILVGSVLGLADGVELLLAAFALDDFFISDLIAFPATQIYLRMKGVDAQFSAWAGYGEITPYLGTLPLRTVGFALTVANDNNPEIMRKFKAGLGSLGEIAEVAADPTARIRKLSGGATAPQGGGQKIGRGIPQRQGPKVISSPHLQRPARIPEPEKPAGPVATRQNLRNVPSPANDNQDIKNVPEKKAA